MIQIKLLILNTIAFLEIDRIVTQIKQIIAANFQFTIEK